MEIKKGTLACRLFGHKFHGEKLEYHPHYLEGVKNGTMSVLLQKDFHLMGFQTDYCVRCGLQDKEKEIMK